MNDLELGRYLPTQSLLVVNLVLVLSVLVIGLLL